MHEAAWEAVERDELKPIPTAPIGKAVQWYISGDARNIVAGVCIGVEGVGRLKIKTFPLNAMPQEKSGVYHKSHVVHTQPNNPTTYRNGSWDFVPGDAVHDEFYKDFREDIQRRKDNLATAEKQAKKAEVVFKERAAELASGKRKPAAILPVPTK